MRCISPRGRGQPLRANSGSKPVHASTGPTRHVVPESKKPTELALEVFRILEFLPDAEEALLKEIVRSFARYGFDETLESHDDGWLAKGKAFDGGCALPTTIEAVA